MLRSKLPQVDAIAVAEQVVTEEFAQQTLDRVHTTRGATGFAEFDAALMRHPVVYWWPWSESWEYAE